MSVKKSKPISTNYSSRGGIFPRLIVLHTTEGDNLKGTADLDGLHSWFNNPSAQVSSHIGIDSEGNKYRFLPDSAKAWTQADYNPEALSIEMVGHSYRKRRFWFKWYRRGLKQVAKQIAYWSVRYKIPIRYSIYKGVCEHRHLGVKGGNHSDCGPGFPFRYVLLYAKLFKWRMIGRPKRYRKVIQRIRDYLRR